MAIWNCPTVSQADFENILYNQSGPGDTIVLPAGSATWGNSGGYNSGVSYITWPLTITGQGDSTIITLDDTGKTYANGVIALWSASTFSNVKILGSSAAPVTAFQISAYGGFTSGFRVTGITYVGGTGSSADGYFVYVQEGVVSGLIDNNDITGNYGGQEFIYCRGVSGVWNTAGSMGTANNIFVENNDFHGTGYICDSNSNGQIVVRFNRSDGENKIDAHGFASNSNPRASCRNIEILFNEWTKAGAGNWSNIEVRGGSAMVMFNECVTGWLYLHDYAYDSEPKPWENFGYSATITAGSPTLVTTAQPHGYSTGWPVWVQAPLGVVYGFYNITVTGPSTFTIPIVTVTNEGPFQVYATTYKTPYDYPIYQQVGSGSGSVGATQPAYLAGNTQGGVSWPRQLGTVCADALIFYRAQVANPAATFTDKDVIKANRDFYSDAGFDSEATGTTIGTAAQMAVATPTNKRGFWVTDEGSWNTLLPANTSGRLYVGNGSSWVLNYTPYTYPHPLANSAPTFASGTVNTAGTAIAVVFSESCTTGAGGNGGVTLSATGGAVTATYTGGSGSTTYSYSLNRTIQQGEIVTVSYVQPGNGIEATDDQSDVASFSGQPLTNNSTQLIAPLTAGLPGTGALLI